MLLSLGEDLVLVPMGFLLSTSVLFGLCLSSNDGSFCMYLENSGILLEDNNPISIII